MSRFFKFNDTFKSAVNVDKVVELYVTEQYFSDTAFDVDNTTGLVTGREENHSKYLIVLRFENEVEPEDYIYSSKEERDKDYYLFLKFANEEKGRKLNE